MQQYKSTILAMIGVFTLGIAIGRKQGELTKSSPASHSYKSELGKVERDKSTRLVIKATPANSAKSLNSQEVIDQFTQSQRQKALAEIEEYRLRETALTPEQVMEREHGVASLLEPVGF